MSGLNGRSILLWLVSVATAYGQNATGAINEPDTR